MAASLTWLVPGFAQQPAADDQPNRDTRGWRRADEARDPNSAPAATASAPAAPAISVPSQIVVPAGTWISIRVNQPLSSDQNLPGDSFTASLAQPVVADGFLIARRGQTVAGRVAEAMKAGRGKGTSRLAIELTELSLVSGQQMPVRSQLAEYTGGTSKRRDATAVATTTGAGAAIGAAAAGGVGAGAGAAAGAVASTIGVLLTRGRATVVYPEAVLTFRTLEPLTINTDRSEHAYLPARQDDFEPRLQHRTTQVMQPAPSIMYGGFGWPYSPLGWGWGNGWGGGWGGYGFGPSLVIRTGPRFYGGGRGGGFRRR